MRVRVQTGRCDQRSCPGALHPDSSKGLSWLQAAWVRNIEAVLQVHVPLTPMSGEGWVFECGWGHNLG